MAFYRGLIGKLRNFTSCRPNMACSMHDSTVQRKSWKVLRVNHIAVATPDLEKFSSFYKDILGIPTSQPLPLPEHGVQTVFIDVGNAKIELLHPLGTSSPIENFLEKNKSGGMHHICLEVDNLKNAVDDLKKSNIRLLSEETKIGAHGKPVIFLHPKDCGILIELEEA